MRAHGLIKVVKAGSSHPRSKALEVPGSKRQEVVSFWEASLDVQELS